MFHGFLLVAHLAATLTRAEKNIDITVHGRADLWRRSRAIVRQHLPESSLRCRVFTVSLQVTCMPLCRTASS